MIDRYAIFESVERISGQFGLEVAVVFEERYNAYPTLLLPVITSRQPHVLSYHHWGVVPEMAANKAVSPKFYNLPLNDLLTKPIHQNSLKKKRCIIPANGFFVWKPIGKKKVVPTYIYSKERDIFGFAGVWDEYEDIRGKKHFVFSMIVLPSTEGMLNYNPYMPVFIKPEWYKQWLGNETSDDRLVAMLGLIEQGHVLSHPVTPKISNQNLNEANLLLEVRPVDQFGNYTLFD